MQETWQGYSQFQEAFFRGQLTGGKVQGRVVMMLSAHLGFMVLISISEGPLVVDSRAHRAGLLPILIIVARNGWFGKFSQRMGVTSQV